MPGMQAPPMAPDVQSQMGGGPGFGAGIAGAQQAAGKSPVELAVGTVEKLLGGIQDEAFKPYATQALAILKVGAAKAAQSQPMSPGGAQPPMGGAGAPGPAAPPTPGAMPG